jgi:hypothetical protein
MPETNRFRTYLLKDYEEGTPVKLDLYCEPWEVTGYVLRVNENTFTFGEFGNAHVLSISDIKHYRVA